MVSVVYATAADFEGRQTEDSLTEDSFKARVEYLAALIPAENKVIYVLLSAAACKFLEPRPHEHRRRPRPVA
jgi:hypothetical protein